MADTTFKVSPEVTRKRDRDVLDYVARFRVALRRPIEQHWLPRNPVVACDNNHPLLTALHYAFYDHVPLRLTPDAVWITIARGLALHVNKNAEELRHKLVKHTGQQKLSITRRDFLPGEENPWPEVFSAFADQMDAQTGSLSKIFRANFSTTGPTEVAASHLMAMDAFKSYFEFEVFAGCGIPQITLAGTERDWSEIRNRIKQFAEYGLDEWVEVLVPILDQFCAAKCGNVDVEFWKSMFRFNSGSGFAVMTGWVNVLFPFLEDTPGTLRPNPFIHDWKHRLGIDDKQNWRERCQDPQGICMGLIPNCMTSVPLTVHWGDQETEMRLVGGLLVVTQDEATKAVEPECGWVVVYENPVDELSELYQWLEKLTDRQRQQNDG
jgi:hypothetical protein